MIWNLPNNKPNEDTLQFLLEKRGIAELDTFLNPSEKQLHDPLLMHGAKEAAEFLIKAIEQKKKIFIHGDFDVDGITATTIMWKFLHNDLGVDALPYIPSRFDEGYGLSDESIQAIIDAGGEVLLTVDCGVKDVELIAKYADQIDFVITDHHSLLENNAVEEATVEGADLRQTQDITKPIGHHRISSFAKAVVHPRLVAQESKEELDESSSDDETASSKPYPYGEICGAVVSWKLCQAINQLGNFGIDTMRYVDLAALGTVCDIMPLKDENRAIVSLGLEKLKETEHEGFRALYEVAGASIDEPKTYHFGFLLGPRLNAAGRLEHALDGVRLLSTGSLDQARAHANKLDALNKKRQDLTKRYIETAESQIESMKDDLVYIVHGEEWPEGIVGLIAGKLTQKYNRPVLAASKLPDGTTKGSARSIEKYHIANAFKELDELFIRHGGHAGAAGFTISSEKIESLRSKLNKHAGSILTQDDLQPELKIDALLFSENLVLPFAEKLSALEPFGTENEEPVFAIVSADVVNHRLVGKSGDHIQITISKDGVSLETIAFGKAERIAPLLSENKPIDIAGHLMIDEWNGNKKVKMRVVDVKISD